MGQALYRKYRSKKFDEVVGQKHITDTLKKALKNGRLSHAYLFTGPRGVGKTTVARILAHEVNGLKYDDDSTHLDIIEIDAASNRRIDEIRELREKVRVSPSSAAYKVYIIDEVHMLTREAFNALLKTLEEPPAHCIFILATTESHKLPETIISRTQRFEFRPIDPKSAAGQLGAIAAAEKIAIDDEALELLALHGEGSFRDSISLLDQLSAQGGKIAGVTVRQFLGLPSADSVSRLTEAIESGDTKLVLGELEELNQQGVATNYIAAALAKQLRTKLIDGSDQDWIAPLLRKLFEVPASSEPAAALEVCLLESASQRAPMQPASPAIVVESKPTAVPKKTAGSKIKPPATVKGFNEQNWQKIISLVREQAASLYTALRLARPRIEDNQLILAFDFPLHKKKLDVAKHKELISKTVAEVTGKDYEIKSVVEKAVPAGNPSKPAQMQTISNIFGQTEMLES